MRPSPRWLLAFLVCGCPGSSEPNSADAAAPVVADAGAAAKAESAPTSAAKTEMAGPGPAPTVAGDGGVSKLSTGILDFDAKDAAGGLADLAGVAGEALSNVTATGPQPHPPLAFKYRGRCPDERVRSGTKIDIKDCLQGPIVAELSKRVKKVAPKLDPQTSDEIFDPEVHAIDASDDTQTGLVAFRLAAHSDISEEGTIPAGAGTPCVGIYEQNARAAELLQFACGDGLVLPEQGIETDPAPRFEVEDVIGDKTPELFTWMQRDAKLPEQHEHKIWASHPSAARWRVVLDEVADCGEGGYAVATLEKGALVVQCGTTGDAGKGPLEKQDRYVFRKAMFVREGDKVETAMDDVLDDDTPGKTAADLALSKYEALKSKAKKALSRTANTRGYRLYWAGDLEGALALFEAAITIDPEFGMPHYSAARIYAIWGKAPEAVAKLGPLKHKKAHRKQLEAAKTAPEFEKIRQDAAFQALFE